MWTISIDKATCTGDSNCVDVCPVTILGMEEYESKQVAVLTGSADDCIGCMACVNACETASIAVSED